MRPRSSRRCTPFPAATIEKLDETHYRVDKAVFTTCEDDTKHPPWSFHLKKALVEVEGYGKFTSSTIKVQGVPVFYLPYMVWPIKKERSPGLLMPGFGYSDRLGAYIGLPVYFPLGRSWDTTFAFEYFSEWVLRHRQRTPVGAGRRRRRDLSISMPSTTNRTPEWEWRINGRHDQADVFGFRLQAQLENLSDPDFWQDFDRTFEANTRRDVYSYLFLTQSWGPYSLNLSADHRRTFLTSTTPNSPQTSRQNHHLRHVPRPAPRGRAPSSLDPTVQQRHLLEPHLVGEPLLCRQANTK